MLARSLTTSPEHGLTQTKERHMSKKKKTKAPDTGAESPTEEPVAPRARQLEIPGAERPKIKDIEVAAEEYVIARDRRMKQTEKEVEAKNQLTALMHAHAEEIGRDEAGGLSYRYDDMLVTLRPKDEVLKVKHVSDEEVGIGKAPADDSEGD